MNKEMTGLTVNDLWGLRLTAQLALFYHDDNTAEPSRCAHEKERISTLIERIDRILDSDGIYEVADPPADGFAQPDPAATSPLVLVAVIPGEQRQ